MDLLPGSCLSFGGFGRLGSAAFSWVGKVTGSAPRGPAPSFISSLSRLASQPRHGSSVNGLRGGQLEASWRRARRGPGRPSAGRPRLHTMPTAGGHWSQGLCPAARRACSAGCWRDWAAPRRAPLNCAPRKETKSVRREPVSKGFRKPPTVKHRNWARREPNGLSTCTCLSSPRRPGSPGADPTPSRAKSQPRNASPSPLAAARCLPHNPLGSARSLNLGAHSQPGKGYAPPTPATSAPRSQGAQATKPAASQLLPPLRPLRQLARKGRLSFPPSAHRARALALAQFRGWPRV